MLILYLFIVWRLKMKCDCAESKPNDRITAARPLNRYRFFSQINSLGSAQLLASEWCKDPAGQEGGSGSMVLPLRNHLGNRNAFIMCNKWDGGANNEKGAAGLLKFQILGGHLSTPNSAARSLCSPGLLFWFVRKPWKGLNALVWDTDQDWGGTQPRVVLGSSGHSWKLISPCGELPGNL